MGVTTFFFLIALNVFNDLNVVYGLLEIKRKIFYKLTSKNKIIGGLL